MIDIQNVTFSYDRKRILDNVSAQVLVFAMITYFANLKDASQSDEAVSDDLYLFNHSCLVNFSDKEILE